VSLRIQKASLASADLIRIAAYLQRKPGRTREDAFWKLRNVPFSEIAEMPGMGWKLEIAQHFV